MTLNSINDNGIKNISFMGRMPSSMTGHGFVGGDTGGSCTNGITIITSATLKALHRQEHGQGCHLPCNLPFKSKA